jgi:peptide/nickel transport system permease protein
MKWSARLGLGLLIALGAAWVFSLLSGYDVIAAVDLTGTRMRQGPSAAHWLGTDDNGRDVAWRVLIATEAFVGPGLLACLIAFFLAVPWGAWAGWKGGWAAEGIRFFFTVLASLPRFVFVLLVCSIYGKGPWTLAIAAGIAYSSSLSEAIYAKVSAFRQAGFVLAAKAHGLSTRRILGKHILWVNCRGLIMRHLLQLFAFFLLVETTLSMLGGYGVQEPAPSWGNMITKGNLIDIWDFSATAGNPWATWAPIIAIWMCMLGCVLLSEGFQEERHGR